MNQKFVRGVEMRRMLIPKEPVQIHNLVSLSSRCVFYMLRHWYNAAVFYPFDWISFQYHAVILFLWDLICFLLFLMFDSFGLLLIWIDVPYKHYCQVKRVKEFEQKFYRSSKPWELVWQMLKSADFVKSWIVSTVTLALPLKVPFSRTLWLSSTVAREPQTRTWSACSPVTSILAPKFAHHK